MPSPFMQLAERYSQLAGRLDITAEDANKEIRQLGAQGGELYAGYADQKLSGFEDIGTREKRHLWFEQHLDELRAGTLHHEDLFWSVWESAMFILGQEHRFRFYPGFGGYKRVKRERAPGHPFYTMEYQPERWKECARDYAAACMLLAELSGERTSAFDLPVVTGEWLDAKTINSKYHVNDYSLSKWAEKDPSIRRAATPEDRKRFKNIRLLWVYDANVVYLRTEGKADGE